MTIKTIGEFCDYIFEENDDWVNDEEALALEKIAELKREYIKDTGNKPTILYVSDDEEYQSYMLWFAPYYGLKAARTEGETCVCGQLLN